MEATLKPQEDAAQSLTEHEAREMTAEAKGAEEVKAVKPAISLGPKRLKAFNYDAAMPIDEWEKWSTSFKAYLRARKPAGITDEVKISVLLDELGPKGKELFERFKTNPTTTAQSNLPQRTDRQDCIQPKAYDLTKFDDVISAFTTFFVSESERNLVYERFKFNTFNWLFGQPLREYIKVLKRAAVRCDFLEMDAMIRDRLLLQVRDIQLLETLLKTKDLTLDKAIEMCQEHEDKDYRHNPAAQRPPPESESAAKRRRKRNRKAVEAAAATDQSIVDDGIDSGAEGTNSKSRDTTKLRPSKKKRHRWAKAIQNVKQAMYAQ